eukprot:gene7715-883_t
MGPATAWRWWGSLRQRRSFQFFIALLLLLNIAASVEVSGPSAGEFYADVLRKVLLYQTEVPQHVLDRGIAQQGSTTRMERFVWKMMHAEPTKIALLGGSMSIRGAKHIDQTFIKQSHKWMETAFVPGCSEQLKVASEAQVKVVADAQDEEKHAQALHAAGIRHTYPYPPLPPRIPQHDALHVVSTPWYQHSGHVCNGSHIELHHLSVPAAGPDYTESCVMQHVPDDADLVIMEFACNDVMDRKHMRTSERMALERMIRTALNFPNKPAVLLFEAFCYSQSNHTFDRELDLAEDKHTLIAKYYGNVQVLSARSAFFDYVKGAGDVPLGSIYECDGIHLIESGHRWYSDLIINYIRHIALRLATRVVAVELGGWHHLLLPHSLSNSSEVGGRRSLLQDKQQTTGGQRSRRALLDALGQNAMRIIEEEILAEQNISSSYCEGARWMVEGKREAKRNMSGVHCEVRGSQAGPRAEGPGESQTIAYRLECSRANGKTMLKQPFFKGNENGGVRGVCAVGPDFTQVVESSNGWEWVDEAADGTNKYGYASTQVGAELIIRINMTVVPGQSNNLTEVMNMRNVDSQHPPNLLGASLIHLKGYKDMGKASLTCTGLCHCHPVTVNGMAENETIHARTPQLHQFYILGNSSLAGSGLVCKVMVKLLGEPNEANSTVNYFKVIGITTSTHSIFHASDIFTKGLNLYGMPGGEVAMDEIGFREAGNNNKKECVKIFSREVLREISHDPQTLTLVPDSACFPSLASAPACDPTRTFDPLVLNHDDSADYHPDYKAIRTMNDCGKAVMHGMSGLHKAV